MKTLVFDANDVSITPRSGSYFTINVSTEYLSEVLEDITPEEIIQNCSDLDKLYELLKAEFNE
jgi:hypothetical protein